MALTFTIGGITFADLAMSGGRKALFMSPDSPNQDIIRYHIRGVEGSFLTRGKRINRPIRARMRYIGDTVSAIYGLFNSDVNSWRDTAVTITGVGGETYNRCTLEPGSMRITGEPKATGRDVADAKVYMDAEATFLSDE